MSATASRYQPTRNFKYSYGVDLRQRCEKLRGALWTERATFEAHWRDLSDFILPRKARFQTTDTNRGERRNQKIIDSTATDAAGILSAGMHAGVTSPARPWYNLTVADPAAAEDDEVKEWLHIVETRMQQAMVKSNFYEVLPILYGDMGVFGTGAFLIAEDDETIFRCYDITLGTYAASNDARRKVRTFVRVFRQTVDAVVTRWGNLDAKGLADFQRGEPSALSVQTQSLWDTGQTAVWVDLVHVIRPNVSYDGVKAEAKYKKYEEIYYEQGTSSGGIGDKDAGILEHSGYDEFPAIVARWEKSGEDVYGTICPGIEALGDIKQLQLMEKRVAQAIELMVRPPMTAPLHLMNAKVTILPGDVTYADVRDGQQGLRPTYEVKFDIAAAENKMEQIRQRINRAFKADLFLMLAGSDRREITAREVEERHEEKLLAIGPTLERINDDALDESIDRIFGIMARKGLFPPPPDAIAGQPLVVQYVSIMAQAQRMIGLTSLERTASFVGQVFQFDPSVLDVVDMDQLVREHVEATGSPPKVLRSEDDVQQIRQAKADAAKQQQAAQNIPNIAGAVRDLSQSPTSGDSALSKILNGRNATTLLNQTNQPATLQ